MDEILRVKSLTKRYGNILALDRLNLSLFRDEVACLVGPNAAGKTTFIETSLGLIKPDEGDVFWFGERVQGRLPSSLLSRIGTMLENVGLHPWIPVVNSLRMLAELYEIDLSEKQLREVLEVVRLETEAAHQLYGRLSYGQKRKAELAAALVTEPDVLILDDPFMGIDPVARLELVGALRQMKEGRTLLYTTHLLDIATRFSDRIFIILNGQIQVMGTVQELIRQYGGKWRVRVASPLEGELPGFERCGSRQYTAETESMTELLGLFQTLAKLPIEELYVDPPTLQGVFETLVREKNP